MNPEFQRNLWLELTPRRMILMVGLLGLGLFAAGLSGDRDSLVSLARTLFYLIVVVWGTRNAALAVVGEIRDRTWDMQLLSSIEPGAMTWGKLFGSTIYNWFGGAICLAVVLSDAVVKKGVPAASLDLVYFIAVGAISQAAALLASLIAVRRRQSHSRLDIFLYQIVGLAAGFAVYSIWAVVDPATMNVARLAKADVVRWWTQTIDTRAFLLVSLAVFTAWTFVGCYREMRLELKMQNGPLVWLGFLLFIGLYVAGFDAWLSNDKAMASWDAVSLRLGLAGATYATLTYLMVVLEPQDRVHYRWLGGQVASGRLAAFFGGLQAWMMSYAATMLCALALIASLVRNHPDHPEFPALIAAGLGFLTRDLGVVVLMRSLPGSRRRGDFGALGILFALYVLGPVIVRSLGAHGALVLFHPMDAQPLWLSPLIAWAEAAIVAVLAVSRFSLAKAPAAA
jgi:hypothetical protein